MLLILRTTLDIGTLGALGYACSEGINKVYNLTHPTLFSRPDFVITQVGATCCALFKSIDLVFKKALEQLFGKKETSRPQAILLRIAAAIEVTARMSQAFYDITLNLNAMRLTIAVTAAAYAQLARYASDFNAM